MAKEGEYFLNGGLLYRKGGVVVVMEEGKAKEQLLLPKLYRAMVLRVAHTIPLAGHLGRNKRAQRIRQRYFWPNVTKDVAEYCQSCAQCQKSNTRKVCLVPLITLPVIDVPFERITMDIDLYPGVGPGTGLY